MNSSCPEAQAQMDFFGVSDASQETGACGPDKRTHAIQVTALDGLDSPMDRPPQLSWLPDPITWTNEDCFAMLEGFLIDQLRLLSDGRVAPELQAEIIAWVAAPKRSLSALKHAPFSFQACCIAAGVDFEEMRESTLRIIAPEWLAQLD